MFYLLLAQSAAVDTDRVLVSGHIVWIVGLALTGFLAVATWGASAWAKAMSAHGEMTLKGLLLAELSKLAESIVLRLNATLVIQYKAASADGKITQAEAKELAATALRELKSVLQETGIARLQKVFGWGPAEVDSQLAGVIEKKVLETKALAAAVKPSSLPVFPTLR